MATVLGEVHVKVPDLPVTDEKNDDVLVESTIPSSEVKKVTSSDAQDHGEHVHHHHRHHHHHHQHSHHNRHPSDHSSTEKAQEESEKNILDSDAISDAISASQSTPKADLTHPSSSSQPLSPLLPYSSSTESPSTPVTSIAPLFEEGGVSGSPVSGSDPNSDELSDMSIPSGEMYRGVRVFGLENAKSVLKRELFDWFDNDLAVKRLGFRHIQVVFTKCGRFALFISRARSGQFGIRLATFDPHLRLSTYLLGVSFTLESALLHSAARVKQIDDDMDWCDRTFKHGDVIHVEHLGYSHVAVYDAEALVFYELVGDIDSGKDALYAQASSANDVVLKWHNELREATRSRLRSAFDLFRPITSTSTTTKATSTTTSTTTTHGDTSTRTTETRVEIETVSSSQVTSEANSEMGSRDGSIELASKSSMSGSRDSPAIINPSETSESPSIASESSSIASSASTVVNHSEISSSDIDSSVLSSSDLPSFHSSELCSSGITNDLNSSGFSTCSAPPSLTSKKTSSVSNDPNSIPPNTLIRSSLDVPAGRRGVGGLASLGGHTARGIVDLSRGCADLSLGESAEDHGLDHHQEDHHKSHLSHSALSRLEGSGDGNDSSPSSPMRSGSMDVKSLDGAGRDISSFSPSHVAQHNLLTSSEPMTTHTAVTTNTSTPSGLNGTTTQTTVKTTLMLSSEASSTSSTPGVSRLDTPVMPVEPVFSIEARKSPRGVFSSAHHYSSSAAPSTTALSASRAIRERFGFGVSGLRPRERENLQNFLANSGHILSLSAEDLASTKLFGDLMKEEGRSGNRGEVGEKGERKRKIEESDDSVASLDKKVNVDSAKEGVDDASKHSIPMSPPPYDANEEWKNAARHLRHLATSTDDYGIYEMLNEDDEDYIEVAENDASIQPDDMCPAMAFGFASHSIAEVQATPKDIFLARDPLLKKSIKEYANALPPEMVVARAKSALGSPGWNPITRNCEHFATWAKTGRTISTQVYEVGSNAAVMGATTMQTIVTIAFLGLLLTWCLSHFISPSNPVLEIIESCFAWLLKAGVILSSLIFGFGLLVHWGNGSSADFDSWVLQQAENIIPMSPSESSHDEIGNSKSSPSSSPQGHGEVKSSTSHSNGAAKQSSSPPHNNGIIGDSTPASGIVGGAISSSVLSRSSDTTDNRIDDDKRAGSWNSLSSFGDSQSTYSDHSSTLSSTDSIHPHHHQKKSDVNSSHDSKDGENEVAKNSSSPVGFLSNIISDCPRQVIIDNLGKSVDIPAAYTVEF